MEIKLLKMLFFFSISNTLSAEESIRMMSYEHCVLNYAVSYYQEVFEAKKGYLRISHCKPFYYEPIIEKIDRRIVENSFFELIEHRGAEIQHRDCIPCQLYNELNAQKQYRKKRKNDNVVFPDVMSNLRYVYSPSLVFMTNKGYVVLHPSTTDPNSYILFWNNNYYKIPESYFNELFNWLIPRGY